MNRLQLGVFFGPVSIGDGWLNYFGELNRKIKSMNLQVSKVTISQLFLENCSVCVGC